MTYHSTGLGELRARDPDAALEELKRTITRQHGNLVRIAKDLGICRRYVYKLVTWHDLWPLVDEARAAKFRRPSELQRAIDLIGGMVGECLDACDRD